MAKNPGEELQELLSNDDVTPETFARVHKLLALDMLRGAVDPWIGEAAGHALEAAIPHVAMRERRLNPQQPVFGELTIIQQLLQAQEPERLLADVDKLAIVDTQSREEPG